MRETVASLRRFFFLSAVLGATTAFSSFVLTPRMRLLAAISGALSVGFGIVSVRLPAMLSGSTAFVRALLVTTIAFQVVQAGLALRAGAGHNALIFPGLAVLVCIHLLNSVARLAREPAQA